MKIRILTAEDAASYWELRLEALERDPEAFGASAEEHRSMSRQDVIARLCADPVNNFVSGAFVDRRLVGTAGVYRDKGLKERHKGHVWGVYVTGEMRSRGIGKRLLESVLDRAATVPGIEQIMLAVAATQDAAISLYRSLGFETYGCEPRALKVGSRYIDEEHMVLTVDRWLNRKGAVEAEFASKRGKNKKRP
ncbi:MAG TPA: GNAT family N-acetyltransferase [Candidatus Aquilonibacter sp.]|nr:GNAT family N-acetyltransferase [Candidatus Aquilonibacter sp.]